MSKSKRTSTDDFSQGTFKPHGRMELELSGQLNILQAKGPFNKELVTAADAAQEGLYEALLQKKRWGTVLIFRESALISLDAVAEITRILKVRVAQGYVPVAVAIVLTAQVEGGKYMKAYYLKAYQEAGINVRAFEDEELAKDWVAGVIEQE